MTLRPVENVRENSTTSYQTILVVGGTGSGKTTQMRTLPGKKLAYLFDPNAKISLIGSDIDLIEFTPELFEFDLKLKGFNKSARPDRGRSKIEPTVYNRWEDDLNERFDSGFMEKEGYDWICLDSLTFLVQALMDRQMFLNGRLGQLEDRGDYRMVGNTLSHIMTALASLPINIYCTGHLSTYQDEKTGKIDVQLAIPGSSRVKVPLSCSNIWLAKYVSGDSHQHILRTRPEPRGFQSIRTSIPGLKEEEDVTIKSFSKAQEYGIGALLTRADQKPPLRSA